MCFDSAWLSPYTLTLLLEWLLLDDELLLEDDWLEVPLLEDEDELDELSDDGDDVLIELVEIELVEIDELAELVEIDELDEDDSELLTLLLELLLLVSSSCRARTYSDDSTSPP